MNIYQLINTSTEPRKFRQTQILVYTNVIISRLLRGEITKQHPTTNKDVEYWRLRINFPSHWPSPLFPRRPLRSFPNSCRAAGCTNNVLCLFATVFSRETRVCPRSFASFDIVTPSYPNSFILRKELRSNAKRSLKERSDYGPETEGMLCRGTMLIKLCQK